MRRIAVLVCLVAAACAYATPALGATPTRWLAGAATISTAPPPRSDAEDARLFPACPATVFSGPRPFDFEEPYVDQNGNGSYDLGEPYCDANGNGRWDGIFTSGQVGHPATRLAPGDDLDARAFAISDGSQTAVIVSVVAQGLFQNYTDQMTAAAKQLQPSITNMIVSATHNESSPDTIGIYGPPRDSPYSAGARSGIDDYYMTWLIGRVAQAAANAAGHLSPASLWARQFPLPANLKVRLSDNWPTTDNSADNPTAIDPKVGLLQARGADGRPIFTVLNVAAHNQEIGHDILPDELSGDWPGYFERTLERSVPGTAVFLVGDNGSQEDPITQPSVCPPDGKCLAQTQATGEAFASAVRAQAGFAEPLGYGALRYQRTDFCVPIENNLFKAASAAGLFGQRQGYTMVNGQCVPTAPPPQSIGPTASGAPDELMTSVSLLDVGPDLQLIANPGEAFPALMLGSPWSFDDVPAACQDRANPPIPTWRGHAEFRLQAGLANDMIGYEIPPWAYISDPGAFTDSDPNCNTNGDPHHQKLETEGVGPTASGAVATNLTALLNADAPDPLAHVVRGRYVLPDGKLSLRPAGAVAILLADAGSSTLDLDHGTLVGLPSVAGAGARAVDATGSFMDYDGQAQSAADITTRGMAVRDGCGVVRERLYVDVFPHLDAPAKVAAPVTGSGGPVCPPDANTVAVPSRGGSPGPPGSPARLGASARPSRCADRWRPYSTVRRGSLRLRRGVLRLSGISRDRGCGRKGAGRVAHLAIVIRRPAGHGRCRFVAPSGRLSAARRCSRPLRLLARGAARWSFTLRLRRVPRGVYLVTVQAVDAAGNVERLRRTGRLRVR